MDELVEALVARLAEDEAWQSGLTDSERTAILKWVREELRCNVQATLTKVRGRLRTIALTMGQSPDYVSRVDVLRALLE